MISRTISGFLRAVSATASIEFAILAIPFFGLSIGVFEFGRACWTQEALQESATQAARCIGVHQGACYSGGVYSASATQTYVQQVASGWGIGVPTADITPTQSTSCGGVAGFAQVQIAYNFSTVAGALIPSLANVAMTANSCFPDNP
ncbi:MAG TPA: TadE family protein [Rhizomicrobium sp.]|jgi:Flp pilus assembly protein TadG|nr:TadE family protein [Rhizomicrobium sp.]